MTGTENPASRLEIGTKGYQEEIVTSELLACHIGSGTVRVFATPLMITLMERTCRLSVQPFLDEGFETVGTLVNVSHVSSTPEGMKVWCDSELVQIDGRRLVFKVVARDPKGIIGEGTHERFIVNVKRFQAKTDAKLA
ncbi:MAG: thioesterase family protein [Bacteroidales bacterium]|nr:thioesterase family protein [Bacteroidales bacterium]